MFRLYKVLKKYIPRFLLKKNKTVLLNLQRHGFFRTNIMLFDPNLSR